MASKKRPKTRIVHRFVSSSDELPKIKTLLTEFIEEKESQYIEPTREGTVRGEVIGLSKVKYKTALLCLRNTRIKEIAETVGVSYGVARKWRTEDSFKSTKSSLQGEFGRIFCDFVLKHNEEQFSGKWRAIPAHRTEKLKDLSSYSKDLIESVTGTLMDLWARHYARPKFKYDDFYTILGIADGVQAMDENLGRKIKKKLFERVKTEHAPAAIEGLRKFIIKPSHTKKDREQAWDFVKIFDFFTKV